MIKSGGITKDTATFLNHTVSFFRVPLGLEAGLRSTPLRKWVVSYRSKKAIIRTHLLPETSSDYIGLVREAGLEPARP